MHRLARRRGRRRSRDQVARLGIWSRPGGHQGGTPVEVRSRDAAERAGAGDHHDRTDFHSALKDSARLKPGPTTVEIMISIQRWLWGRALAWPALLLLFFAQPAFTQTYPAPVE